MAASQFRHPIFARVYERFSAGADAAGVRDHRQELLDGLRGRVIEVGAGNGLNFRHYPQGVTEVVAIEPEPYLRERACESAAASPVAVSVVEGVAGRLPAPDGAFDAAVVSLVLCSVPDQAEALAEVRRVLRGEGELRFYEHVRADTGRLARVQSGLDRTVWPHLSGGCHMSRDTVAAISAAGFDVERIRRFTFKPCFLAAPVSPHVIGVARRRRGRS